ncbi:hypothetical protein ACFXI8_09040 [Streptomyces niveus]|uniref:hypothetical protein n=1 Tax=Streptomyces niveus TaxID=193462 RepID=UPI0036C384ED
MDHTESGPAGSVRRGFWERHQQTFLSGGALLISVASLVLSLLAFLDVRESTEQAELREASKVSWSPLWGDESSTPTGVMVENRSMDVAFDVWLNIEKKQESESKDGENLQRFEFGKIAPCTQDRFEFGVDRGHQVKFNESAELFFTDPLRRSWRVTPTGYPEKWPTTPVSRGEGVDLVAAWSLPRATEPARNCA